MFFLILWNRFALAQEIQEASSTQVWIECQPISGLFELSEHLPVSMKNGTGAFSHDTMEVFSQLGGVMDGTLFAYGEQSVDILLPYSGKLENVPTLLSALYPESEVWTIADGQWSMELPEDAWMVHTLPNALRLSSVNSTYFQTGIPSTIYPSLDVTNGCVFTMENGPYIERIDKNVSGSLVIPFDDSPFGIVFKPANFSNVLPTTGASPIDIRTKKQPVAVLTLGFPVLDILNDANVQEKIGLSEKDVRKIQRKIRIAPGSVLALENLNIQNNPQVWYVAEIHNRFHHPRSTLLLWKGIQRVLRKANIEFVILDEHLLSFDMQGRPLYLGVQKGTVFLTTKRDIIDEMFLNEGDAWVNDNLRTLAEDNPFAVQVNIPPMMGMIVGGLQSVELGARGLSDLVYVSVSVDFAGSTSGILSLLSLFEDRLGTENPETPTPVLHMMRIAAKEKQHYRDTATHLPLYVQSSDIGDIPSEMVTNVPVDAKNPIDLGWLEQNELENEIIWVETNTEGFLVHVVYMDANSLQTVHMTKDHMGVVEYH